LLFPIIAIVARSGGIKMLFGLLFLSIALLELAVQTKFMPFPSWMMASTWGAYRAFADFVVGAIVAKLAMDLVWSMQSPIPAWLAMAISCISMQQEMPAYLIFGMLSLALLLAAISEKNAPDRSKWLDVFGPIANVSFGIYLWHPVVEAVMLSFVWRRFVEPTGLVNFYLFMLVPMILTVIVALLSYRLVEKPANNWILNRAGFKHSKINAEAVVVS
jgi:peptidoglycan/LPS O-acetylase OafA/YrhL